MSRFGGGGGHTSPPLSNRSKTTFEGFLDLVDIGGAQSYGSRWKTQNGPKFGDFRHRYPKKS